MRIFLIAGKAGSGKNVVAKLIKEYYIYKVNESLNLIIEIYEHIQDINDINLEINIYTKSINHIANHITINYLVLDSDEEYIYNIELDEPHE